MGLNKNYLVSLQEEIKLMKSIEKNIRIKLNNFS